MPSGIAMGMAMAICAASLACSALHVAGATVAKNDSPEDYIVLHNAARAVAGAGPLSWDAEAARHAAKRAAAGCTGLRGSTSAAAVVSDLYGENIFLGTTATPGKEKAWAAADAMHAWTAPAAAEYVQVVWPGSDRVGCAHAVCAGERGVVISCSYIPAVKEELRGAPLPSYCRYKISRCLNCPIC